MARTNRIGTRTSSKTASASETVRVDTGAEAFVEMLSANDVDYIFLNPGTDTTPIQEALVKLRAQGRRTPQFILCLDEYVAMSAACGYFMLTRKPQVVIVHVDLGTLQVGGALHNAQRSRMGVVLCAGRAPTTVLGGERQGPGRDGQYMWWQEQFDQAGIVRNYVKWDYELRSAADAPVVVQRAFQVAANEPCGPVYLTLPRNVLTEKLEQIQIPDATRYGKAITPQADTVMLAKAAEILLDAENPLIITGHSGRNTETVAILVKLAESLGARVVNSPIRMCFPNNHPLCIESDVDACVAAADAILIIDTDVPYIPANVSPRPDCKIIQIDIDPIKERLPMWGFPTDILLHADSSKALPLLNELISQRITLRQKSRAQDRLRQLAEARAQQQAKSSASMPAKSRQTPISSEWVGYCLNELIDDDTIILEEFGGLSVRHIRRTKPGTFFKSGGSSLGWALGAAMGAKLASPDKTIISLVGDGSFVFGCPTATLWAANAYHLPFLSIIFNNNGYNAIRSNLRATFGTNNFAEKDAFSAGFDFTPCPDFALLSQSAHAYGETVTDPAKVKAALKRGLERVKHGQAAVLDMRTALP